MAETAFIDLMAFARGSELANQANWRDAFNDMNLRAAESNLARQEMLFDTNLPALQAQAGLVGATARDATAALQDNLEAAQWQSDITNSLSNVPVDQQGMYIADQVQQRIQTSTRPRVQNAMRAWALTLAGQQAKAGNVDAARALFNASGNATAGQQLAQAMQWSNPDTALDPVNIASAQGVLGEDGMVTAWGRKMTPEAFAQVQQRLALNAGTNVPALLQPLADQQKAQQDLLTYMQQRAAAVAPLGQRLIFNPDAPGLGASLVPMPQVQPTYPETAGVRYGTPQGVAPTGAAPAAAAPAAPTFAPMPTAAQQGAALAQLMANSKAAIAATPSAPAAAPMQMQVAIDPATGRLVARPATAAPAQPAAPMFDPALLQMLANAGRWQPMQQFQMPASAQAPGLWLTQPGAR